MSKFIQVYTYIYTFILTFIYKFRKKKNNKYIYNNTNYTNYDMK